MLGPFAVASGGSALPVAAAKQRALLALLALHANEVVSADRLIEALWGERPPKTAITALHGYVSQLRKLLPPGRLATRSPGYVLSLERGELDRDRFCSLAAEGRQALAGGSPELASSKLTAALSLFRGAPLSDFAYQPFAQDEIGRLEELRLAALENRVDADLALARHGELVGELEALAAQHPLRERLRAQLMLALYRSGRQAEALEVYRDTRMNMLDELGLEPSLALKELEAAILRQDPALTLKPPDLRSRSHLPRAPNALVGRKRELAEVVELVASGGTRLVTLTGPGGIGKTRLALAAAEQLAANFCDGVWFVGLAALADPTLVVSAVAGALGAQERPEEPLELTLAEYLGDKELMVVVDNFEHLLEAATALSDLLKEAPRLKLLVTSRVRLDLYGEHDYDVPPLALPHAGLEDVDALERHDAVALFVDRARGARRDFKLTRGSAKAVAKLCIALDGLPLALELAAARLRTLSINELVGGLPRRLDLLSEGARDVPARQRTLRTTIAWSYSLLAPEEQLLFRRLSVFAGGCGAVAVEAVCNSGGELGIDVLHGLNALVEQSLLVQNEDQEHGRRFRMLETIGEYAAERLEAEDNASQIRWGHAEFFLTMAEQAEPELRGADQFRWFTRLVEEHDNLRMALGRSLDEGEDEGGLRLASALVGFWIMHGDVAEGMRWLELVLLDSEPASPKLRASALNGAGRLAFEQADYGRAEAFFDESLSLYRRVGNRERVAGLLSNVGAAATHRGERERGRALYEESLALAREIGNTRSIAFALNNVGAAAMADGDYSEAAGLFEESLALLRELGDDDRVAASFANLGSARLALGDFTQAAVLLQEGLALFRHLGENVADMATCLVGLAEVAAMQEHVERAAYLLGATKAFTDEIGSPLQPMEEAMHERVVAAIRSALDDATFASAWADGRAGTLEETIEFALSDYPNLAVKRSEGAAAAQ